MGREREAIELKVRTEDTGDPLPDGLAQFDGYLSRLGLDSGALLIFDRRPSAVKKPLDPKSLAASVIEAGGVTDIYAAAGIDRPDLSKLDEAFIERMRAQRHPALAIEALRRVIEQEMRQVTRHNVVKQASFSERLADLMRRYTNQNLSSAEIIALMVELGMEVAADANRGSSFAPPLNNNELAFCDAVAQNESAVTEMGDTKLADIARDLVRTLRRDVTTDWVSRDDVRAKIRSTIKRLLAKHGYPQTAATTPRPWSSAKWKPSPANGPLTPPLETTPALVAAPRRSRHRFHELL